MPVVMNSNLNICTFLAMMWRMKIRTFFYENYQYILTPFHLQGFQVSGSFRPIIVNNKKAILGHFHQASNPYICLGWNDLFHLFFPPYITPNTMFGVKQQSVSPNCNKFHVLIFLNLHLLLCNISNRKHKHYTT